MLSKQAKKVFSELELPYCAVAVKFCRNKPENYHQAEGTDVFCSFLKKAQDENRAFFTTIENDKCMGKVVLGMTDLETNHGSGQVGYEMGVFRTPAANARLYHEATMLKRGVCNFVVFCPVAICDFHPDLVICIAPAEKAQLLLRATSYISGDLWESRCSYVMSCAWTYAYPYVSGKVNHLFTGMHFGMQIRQSYPQGLHIITIPYQKLDEVVTALTEMEHMPLELLTDSESKTKCLELHARLDALAADINIPNRL
ncbi:MAG: DUF169 domain-containing protein [Acidobacteria bacterium]|nr:DUF169 domain-containing protein [Acidobacteriota bacterium]